ncbi:MAG: hypothetical protein M1818_007775 [Claussenomyces sp. TS43310]|nr:MAG: hypothetical protein M1818_007775 [Claussenomyces sp. TS43310]
MSHFYDTLQRAGIQEYSERLADHGFNNLEDLSYITERDMAALKIKLGHRRKLQRVIDANARVFENASVHVAAVTSQGLSQARPGRIEDSAAYHRQKRRYRRRPAKDPNAPRRPDTGYMSYTKLMRQDPEIASLPFVDIAKLVGERWSSLRDDVRDVWKSKAADEMEAYKVALAEYEETRSIQQRSRPLSSKEQQIREAENQLMEPLLARDDMKQDLTFPNLEGSLGLPIRSDSFLIWPDNEQVILSTAQQLPQTILNTDRASDAGTHSLCQDYDNDRASSQGSSEADGSLTISTSLWSIISQEQQYPGQFNRDELSPNSTFYRSTGSQSFHVKAINPFNFLSRSNVLPMIDSFLQNVNSIYYLVDPDYLMSNLTSVFERRNISNDVMSTLCLCISIGCRTCEHATDDIAIMWYENGRRYLDDDNWGYKLVVMRALALVSIFHMGERPETSKSYLAIAVSIGKSNGLDTTLQIREQALQQSVDEWLHVWDTIKIVHRQDYFLAQLQDWFSLLPDESFLPVDHSTQRLDMTSMQIKLSHLSQAQKSELLHLHCLYLGIISFLTKPSLQRTIAKFSKQCFDAAAEAESHAYRCLSSAILICDLCTTLLRTNAFPQHAGLPLSVLFQSSLASALGKIWQYKVLAVDCTASHNWLVWSSKSIEDVLYLLESCAARNEQARRYHDVLQRVSSWIEDIYIVNQHRPSATKTGSNVVTKRQKYE